MNATHIFYSIIHIENTNLHKQIIHHTWKRHEKHQTTYPVTDCHKMNQANIQNERNRADTISTWFAQPLVGCSAAVHRFTLLDRIKLS